MSDDGFAGWYAREAPAVHRALALAIGDRRMAEDCVAEAFARAWADWGRVKDMASPTGWVYRVALNEARSTFRRRRRRATVSETEHAAPSPTTVDPLWEAVASLGPRARQAIALRYIADLPEDEVAALMGIARGTVAATLHQARRRLAVMLDEDEDEDEEERVR